MVRFALSLLLSVGQLGHEDALLRRDVRVLAWRLRLDLNLRIIFCAHGVR